MKNYDRKKLIEETKVSLSRCAIFRKLTEDGLEKVKKIYETNKHPNIKAFIEETEEWLRLTDDMPKMEDFSADKEILKGN